MNAKLPKKVSSITNHIKKLSDAVNLLLNEFNKGRRSEAANANLDFNGEYIDWFDVIPVPLISSGGTDGSVESESLPPIQRIFNIIHDIETEHEVLGNKVLRNIFVNFGLNLDEKLILSILLCFHMDRDCKTIFKSMFGLRLNSFPVHTVVDLLEHSLSYGVNKQYLTLFSSEARLVKHGLLIYGKNSTLNDSVADREVHISERVIALLSELSHEEPLLESQLELVGCRLVPGLLMEQSEFERDIFSQCTNISQAEQSAKNKSFIYIKGATFMGRQDIALHMCGLMKKSMLIFDASIIVKESKAIQRKILHSLERECLLLNTCLFIKNFDTLLPPEQSFYKGANEDAKETHDESLLKLILYQFDKQLGVSTFLSGSVEWQPENLIQFSRYFYIALNSIGIARRLNVWDEYLAKMGHKTGKINVRALTERYRLSARQVKEVIQLSESLAETTLGDRKLISDSIISKACGILSNHRLAQLTEKVEPFHSWDDLVLPDNVIQHLKDIHSRILSQFNVLDDCGFETKLAMGKGLCLLFGGIPGTGKTMCASVLAKESGYDLFKVDLSMVVSKYIGETEKNLKRIFDEGEGSNAILLFDEADSMFGKRTEVNDSHDRYANMETSYLLQRMEQYRGIIILTTNLENNIDDAFNRRIHHKLIFKMPEYSERLTLWKKIWPKQVELATDVPLEKVARELVITGGVIRNIAFTATHLAVHESSAGERVTIHLSHIKRAVMYEYQKMGIVLKPLSF